MKKAFGVFLLVLLLPSFASATVTRFFPGGNALIGKDDSAVWSTTRDAVTGTTLDSSSVSGSIKCDGTANYIIQRLFLDFDTSALDDTALISAVTLGLYTNIVVNNDTVSADIVPSSVGATSSYSLADFDQASTTVLATRALSGISNGQYATFTLGTSTVSTSSLTLLASRLSPDTNNVSSSCTANNALNVNFLAEAGTSTDPYLEVTWTLPGGGATSSATSTLAFTNPLQVLIFYLLIVGLFALVSYKMMLYV